MGPQAAEEGLRPAGGAKGQPMRYDKQRKDGRPAAAGNGVSMARKEQLFICDECGFQTPTWWGDAPPAGSGAPGGGDHLWCAGEAGQRSPRSSRRNLPERRPSGIAEFDRVLRRVRPGTVTFSAANRAWESRRCCSRPAPKWPPRGERSSTSRGRSPSPRWPSGQGGSAEAGEVTWG